MPTIEGTALDPAAGELDPERAARKRDQILSAAAYAVRLLRPNDCCVEFGSGQGHLGLLIACARPDVTVTLVEVKQYSCDGARTRMESLRLRNCSVFCGTVDEFAASGAALSCAVGLHLCGLLTDSVLELAIARAAAVALVPCCYGQLVGGTNHARGGGTAPCMHPRSAKFRAALAIGREAIYSHAKDDTKEEVQEPVEAAAGGEVCGRCSPSEQPPAKAHDAPQMSGEEAFKIIAQAADTAIVGPGGRFDPASEPARRAFRCMRLVDTDRCLHILESWGAGTGSDGAAARRPRVSIGRLEPPTCTPKASLLIVERPHDVDDAWDDADAGGVPLA